MKTPSFWLCLVLACSGCAPPGFESVVEVQPDATKSDMSAVTLATRVDRALETGLRARELSSPRNAAWQIMHGVACYGHELEISTPDRGRVGALDYAFHNGQINGFELSPGREKLPVTGRVGVKARLEPGSYVGQGHVDQWIAILAMADIPLSDEIMIGDQRFTVEDLARQAQFDVTNNPLEEYSWTLIALTHYFPDEPTWLAAGDFEVSWELLVEQELTKNLDESPCGGTHRLAGIVHALQAKKRLGLVDSEIWIQAETLVNRLLGEVEEHRGSDGRLSSFYLARPGRTFDLAAELASTGHLFEFVALATSDTELRGEWVASTAGSLCGLLESTAAYDLDCGALYHALNGLKIYRARRFGSGGQGE